MQEQKTNDDVGGRRFLGLHQNPILEVESCRAKIEKQQNNDSDSNILEKATTLGQSELDFEINRSIQMLDLKQKNTSGVGLGALKLMKFANDVKKAQSKGITLAKQMEQKEEYMAKSKLSPSVKS